MHLKGNPLLFWIQCFFRIPFIKVVSHINYSPSAKLLFYKSSILVHFMCFPLHISCINNDKGGEAYVLWRRHGQQLCFDCRSVYPSCYCWFIFYELLSSIGSRKGRLRHLSRPWFVYLDVSPFYLVHFQLYLDPPARQWMFLIILIFTLILSWYNFNKE